MLKRKWINIFLGVALLLLIVIVSYISWFKINSNALWNIVNTQCIPLLPTTLPCLKVEQEKHYVLFKDKKGPLHNLIIPTEKITGIESSQLLEQNSPDYFAIAWQERGCLSQQTNHPIPEHLLAIAVNSQYGRSQDQLHIHIACLKPEINKTLNQLSSTITTHWASLSSELASHHYLAKKFPEGSPHVENSFHQLNEYVIKHHDKMGNFGLAMVQLKDGSKVLLANRLNFWDLNLGSAGELLDYQCLANQ
ncbi:CDP-diacylglycerol diphosphatase [Providencia rettgeri]